MTSQTITISHEAVTAIQASSLAPATKRKYAAALQGYLATGARLTDSQALRKHAQSLTPTMASFLRAAVKLWTKDKQRQLKANVLPATLKDTQAALYRLEALADAIQVSAPKGALAHIWLTQKEVQAMMRAADATPRGRRDKAALGLLVGAGLRRSEACRLRFKDISRQGERTVIQVRFGKGGKHRIIPISEQLAFALRLWSSYVAQSGLILRGITAHGKIKDSMSQATLVNIVQLYGDLLGKPELSPHDLRRTYAQLGYQNDVPLRQLQRLLGHASIETTARYLNAELDLTRTASDFVPME